MYHVFNRGNGKRDIFHDEEDSNRFIKIISKYRKIKKFKIYHWIIMPNHYHILMHLEEPRAISSIMAGIGRSYVHYYHPKYDSAGHLFQGRFKCQPVEAEEYLIACGRYIERNPVAAGIEKKAEKYVFSSAGYYCYGLEDDLTQRDPSYDGFGKEEIERQHKYRQFLREFDRDEDRVFNNLEEPAGSEEFLRRLQREKGIFVPKNGRPSRKQVK
ncbi:MAG: transposase [Candidatus Omnitrophica bacterium]|nr:transposase [Candidatus Omnitrophota bacterium]MBU4478613.1 transposase [Candidatus Omnitrophota bacterium]